MAIYKGYSSVGRNFSGTEVVDTALVRADLLNHFNTRQGERVMQPTFGCLVWQYLFDPFTDNAKFNIIENLQEIVAKDPRVVLRDIDVAEYEHGLSVALDLVYAETNEVETMKVNFDQRSTSAVQV
jgi:phage baseplate assembly protein W